MRRHTAFGGLSLLVALSTSLDAQDSTTDPTSERLTQGLALHAFNGHCSDQKAVRSVEDVMRAALALLPEQPAYVSLIDVDAQDDSRVRETLRPLEAFTLPRKQGVYVNLHGATLRRAIETRDERIYRFDVHVLAAIVWHEMAHIAGADEAGAQAREEKLWKQFIRDRRLDIELALRQMQIYASRRPR